MLFRRSFWRLEREADDTCHGAVLMIFAWCLVFDGVSLYLMIRGTVIKLPSTHDCPRSKYIQSENIIRMTELHIFTHDLIAEF